LDKTVKKTRTAFLGFMRKIYDFFRARVVFKPKAQTRSVKKKRTAFLAKSGVAFLGFCCFVVNKNDLSPFLFFF
jgi:hypothetical protein